MALETVAYIFMSLCIYLFALECFTKNPLYMLVYVSIFLDKMVIFTYIRRFYYPVYEFFVNFYLDNKD